MNRGLGAVLCVTLVVSALAILITAQPTRADVTRAVRTQNLKTCAAAGCHDTSTGGGNIQATWVNITQNPAATPTLITGPIYNLTSGDVIQLDWSYTTPGALNGKGSTGVFWEVPAGMAVAQSPSHTNPTIPYDATYSTAPAIPGTSPWNGAGQTLIAGYDGYIYDYTGTGYDSGKGTAIDTGAEPDGTVNQHGGSVRVTVTASGQVVYLGGSGHNAGMTRNYEVFPVTLSFNAPNTPPTAIDDTASTDEDTNTTNLQTSLLSNDSDGGDGPSALDITAVDTSLTTGSVAFDDAGDSVVYSPNGQFDYLAVGENATDTFDYTVSDGAGTDIGRVTVTVNGVNDAPTAVADTASTDEDNPTANLHASLLSNDTDPDTNDTLDILSVDTTGTFGSVTFDGATNSLVYNPNGQFESLAVGESATDTFDYTVTDGNGGTSTTTVTVTVNGANDAPTANNDTPTTNEDTATANIHAAVLANDTDPDTNDTLDITSIDTTGTTGAVTFDGATNTLIYDPNGQFESLAVGDSTTDSFSYTMNDGNGGTSSATVTVTITGVNDAPVAGADTASTDEDNPTANIHASLLSNDTDADTGGTLDITAVNTTGTTGAVSFDGATDSLLYDPNGQFEYLAFAESTTDTFTYTVTDPNGGTDTATVTVTVNGVNDAPTANNDSGAGFTTTQDLAFTTGNVLTNDTDPDASDTLSVSGYDVTSAQGFTVASNGDGTFNYTPTGGFTGNDTFNYTASDGNGGTSSATVTITVTTNNPPVATDDTASTDEDNPTANLQVSLLSNDSDGGDGGALDVTAVDTTGTTGTVIFNDGTDSVVYDPNGQFESLAVGESTTDTFTYTVSDTFSTDTGLVTVTVNGVNDAPTANDDSGAGFSTSQDVAFTTGNVLANDTDPDTTDTLSVSAFDATSAQGFTVSSNGNGTFDYTPTGGFTGTDSFSYTASDGNGGTNSATVTISVGANNPPVATDDTASTDEDNPTANLQISLLSNDSDGGDGGALDVTAVDTTGTTGTVIFNNGADSVVYDPNGQFESLAVGESTTDTFTYTVSDTFSTDTGLVTVTVNGVNDAPTANDDSGAGFSTTQDVAFTTGNVLTNDTDPDTSDTLSVSVFDATSAQGGSVSSNGNGTFDYTPPAAYTGNDTFNYTASDGNGGTSSATVTISVGGALCSAAQPTVTIVPSGQYVAPGESITYTVTVQNNDSAACANTTFTLTATDDDDTNTDFADPTVASPLVVAPGASDSAILTVTAQAGATEGISATVSVTVSDTDGVSPPDHSNEIRTTTATIQQYNPMVHSSASTGSTYWGGDWGVTSGSKYGKFDCATCHAKETGNIKRVRTTFNSVTVDQFPIEADGGTVIFNSVTGDGSFGDDFSGRTTSDRVCEGCHTQTKYHRYDTTNQVAEGGTLTHANNTDCTACHPHNQGFKALDCDACHGGGTTGSVANNYWPDNSTGDAFNQEGRHKEHLDLLALRVYGYNATTLLDQANADAEQKALCAYCHAVNDDDHATNETAEVFTATVGGSLTTVAKTFWDTTDQAPIAAYDSGADSCASVDCHNSQTTPVGFGWYEASVSTCTMCHSTTGTEVNGGKHPLTGLHAITPTISGAQHDQNLDAGGCETCHTANPSTGHLSGSFADTDVVIYNAISYTNSSPETCMVGGSLGACHADGGAWARRWSNTAQNSDGTECVNCHAAYADKAAPVDPASYLAIDGVSQRHDQYNATIFNNHGGTDNGGCYQCHGYSPADATFYDISGALHRDGIIQLNSQNGFTDNNDGTVGCAACHSTSGVYAFDDTLNGDGDGFERWGRDLSAVTGPQAGCNACHGGTDGSGNPQYWPDGTGSGYQDTNVGAHDNHILALADHLYSITTLDGLRADADTDTKQKVMCAFCHPDPGGNGHLENVAGGTYNSPVDRVDLLQSNYLTYDGAGFSKVDTASGAYDYTNLNCSNLACHDRTTTPSGGNDWNTPPATPTCALCHVQANFENDAHQFHVGTTAQYNAATNEINTCIECHIENDANGTFVAPDFPDATGDLAHANGWVEMKWDNPVSMEGNAPGDSSITYNAAGAVASNAWAYEDGNVGSCSSAVCHNNKETPVFSQTILTDTNCVICHTAGGHASDVGNPNSGLHTGANPTVTGVKHDENLTAGTTNDCVVCHTTFNNISNVKSTHINATFTGDANLGLFAAYNQASPSCSGSGVNGAAGCHGASAASNGDDGSWARLWDSTVSYASDGTECAGCHGGFNNDWTFSEASTADATTNQNIDHTLDWDGDGTAGEVIGNHSDSADLCRSCHVYPDSPYNLTWGNSHGNGSIDMNDTVGYSRSGGSAYGCSSSCHTDNTGHVMADSGWGLSLVSGPALDCLDCHSGSAATVGTGLAVTDTSPHAQNHAQFDMSGTGVTADATSQGCKDCHFASHAGQATGTINITNNATMGIDYSVSGGSGVYIQPYGGSTNEAETCWNCHNAATSQTAPFEFNNDSSADAGDWYIEGTVDGTNWTTDRTWTSSAFAYKTSTIHSTHEVGEHTTTTDSNSDGIYDTLPTIGNTDGVASGATGNLNCSWCHDVHGVMGFPVKRSSQSYSAGTVTVAWNDSPTVFLRGPWYQSPYAEDGAPGLGSGNTTGGFVYPNNTQGYIDGNDGTTASGDWGSNLVWNADPDPAAGGHLVGPNHLVRIQSLASMTNHSTTETDWPFLKWGVHIDDNVYGTTGWVGYNTRTDTSGSASTGATPATLGTVNHIDYSTTVNLCMKCHGTLTNLKSLWSGHNVVNGGTGSADIFTGEMAIHQHYMYRMQREMDKTTNGPWTEVGTDVGYAGDLDTVGYGSGSYYDWSVDLSVQANGNHDLQTQTTALAVTDASTGTQKFHKFTCSKCHSPHASINARLMLTNCMNRDGTGSTTFNEREGGPNALGFVTPATTNTSPIGVTYPDPQNDEREMIEDPATGTTWRAEAGGQNRAVHCHNNMVSGGSSTHWQSIQ